MRHTDYASRFEAMVSDAADSWQSAANRLACSGIFPEFRLYYRPTDGSADGRLYLIPIEADPDPSWLAAPIDALPQNLTRAAMRARIHDAAQRLPILGRS